MPETAATIHAEVRKRRSTRIVQAVPLVVTGVDALGRPFQEHTSTLTINCHGARYQSKHYVLKNMWVRLEVPHPGSGHEPRAVRGKVTWIQRPRSVRQLFQIALELENPGNLWGIAFPPEDWFPFTDNRMVQAIDEPAPLFPEDIAPQTSGGLGGDNLDLLPVMEAVDALQAMKQQVSLVVADARQQVESGARVDDLIRAVVEQAQTRLDEMSTDAAEKFRLRAEAILEDIAAREIRPLLESAGRESMEHFAAQLEARIEPHLKRADSIIEKLAIAPEPSEEALQRIRDRVEQMAGLFMQDAAGRFQANLSAMETAFQESAASIRAAWLAECEQHTDEVRNAAADSLGKIAEWYEKKTQIQMQTAIDKGMEQAGLRLRERAGELSGVFAAELDHSSRSYVGHTQTQMDEAANKTFDRARNLFGEAAETTAAAFTDEIRRAAQGEVETFHRLLEQAREDARAQMEAHSKQLQESHAQAGDASLESYKKRLENISNAWILAMVTSLDQYSQGVVAKIAQSIEDPLREACSKAFAGIGESLLMRLVEMAANFPAHPRSTPDK